MACWVERYGLSERWFFWGREKSWSFDIDTVTLEGVTFLPEGCRVYPFPTPRSVSGETLWLVRAAVSSSSLSFLEVPLGTRWIKVLGLWWDFSGEDAMVAGLFRFR